MLSTIAKIKIVLNEWLSLSPRKAACLVALIALLTIGRNYWYPASFYWDENYHIASAQKYLNGVFFLECHPPLGKLLVAAGEALFQSNDRNDQFIGTENAPKTPPGFSFVGYRFFPVLFSIFAAVLFYELLLALLKRPDWALLLSLGYLLDTALIIHNRGARLEGIQICFLLAALVAAVKLSRIKNGPGLLRTAIIMGAAFGLAVSTKMTSLFLLAGLPMVIYQLRSSKADAVKCVLTALGSAAVVFSLVWYVHFALLSKVHPDLPANGTYGAPPELIQIISSGQGTNILNLPKLMLLGVQYSIVYQRGVPALNLCKEDEFGSPAYLWPIGARSIPYGWAIVEDKIAYAYLQANPAVWLISLLGVLASAALLAAKCLFWRDLNLKHGGTLAQLFFLYCAYMGPMLFVGRVMYLYHYLVPLLIGILLFAAAFYEISSLGPWKISEKNKDSALYAIAFLIICGFIYFRPLTYLLPLTNEELAARAWIPLWDVRCSACYRTPVLAFPPAPSIKGIAGMRLEDPKTAPDTE